MYVSSKLKLFFRFLKEKGVLNKYIDRLYKSNITLDVLENLVEYCPENMFNTVLPWYRLEYDIDLSKVNTEWKCMFYLTQHIK